MILGVLLSTSLVYPAVGVKYTPGLQAGDSAFYSLSGNYGFIPTEPVTQMKVSSVIGTNVSASFVNFYPDGHISPDFWIDVFSGQRANLTSTFYFDISSGLKRGDQIFSGWSNATVTTEQNFSCGGVQRYSLGVEFFPSGGTVIIIWDQATGAMCYYSATNNQKGETLTLSMINSTLWSRPTVADPLTVGAEISALVGLPLVVVIMFVYVRRKRAKK